MTASDLHESLAAPLEGPREFEVRPQGQFTVRVNHAHAAVAVVESLARRRRLAQAGVGADFAELCLRGSCPTCDSIDQILNAEEPA